MLRVEGRVVACNLDAFKASAQAFLERLPKPADLQTDQDFADAKAAVNAIAEARDRIKAAKAQGMAQMGDVETVFRTADEIDGWLQKAHAALDKAVKAENDHRKAQRIVAAQQAFNDNTAVLQTEIKGVTFAPPMPDFALAIKGLKTLVSIQEKLDTALAHGKIAADTMATEWRRKLAYFNDAAAKHKALFADLQNIMAKPEEDFRMTVAMRINRFEVAEEQRLAAERERIAAEERAKIEAEERARAEAAAQAGIIIPQPAVGNTGSHGSAVSMTHLPEAVTVVEQPAPGLATWAPACSDEKPTLRLGQINARLSPVSIDAAGLALLGFPHAATDKAAKLYLERNWLAICQAISRRVLDASGGA